MGSRESGAEYLVISSFEDVERLQSSPVRLWKLDDPIELRIPDIEQSERERLESRLNELAGVCGCAEGSIAGAIALIAIAVFWVQRGIAFSFQSILAAGAMVIGIALAAKFVRVLVARVLLHRALGGLLRALPRKSPAHQREAMR